jgi:hypothetical protein
MTEPEFREYERRFDEAWEQIDKPWMETAFVHESPPTETHATFAEAWSDTRPARPPYITGWSNRPEFYDCYVDGLVRVIMFQVSADTPASKVAQTCADITSKFARMGRVFVRSPWRLGMSFAHNDIEVQGRCGYVRGVFKPGVVPHGR